MNVDAKQYRKRRRGVMRAVARSHNLKAAMITDAIDIRYLTGCSEGAGCLLLVGDAAVILTSRMFLQVIKDHASGVDVRLMTKGLYGDVAAVLRENKHRAALGFQSNVMTVLQYRAFERAMGRRKLVSMGDAVVVCRAVKEDAEVRQIRRCVRIAERAFLDLIGQGRQWMIGKTEKQLAAELEYRMRMAGADSQAFTNGIIVASGPNSASCHHAPTNRKVKDGEAVLFDWGAKIDSYQSDITRVVFIGRVPDRLAEIYPVVLEANRVGIAAVRSGVRCHTVAKKAWGVVRDAGYGELIRHGLGHGLGMQTHERPSFGDGLRYNRNANPALKKGMVVTIEPGIYFHGVGGIRIEDDILVTSSGCRSLTTLTRDMERLVLR